MGHRKTVLATGEIYHVFNRSAHKMTIFRSRKDYLIFLEAASYYLQPFPPTRFSMYRRMKNQYELDFSSNLVTILNYCLMPNHFHFTIRQETENGIKDFIRRLTGSFAHYFNQKYDTSGPVFTGNFKAVRLEDQDQLVHLSRYIHLNPVTSYLVEKPEDYDYSSYRIYLNNEKSNFIDSDLALGGMKRQDYEKFVLDQIDYQRYLKSIRHLIIE